MFDRALETAVVLLPTIFAIVIELVSEDIKQHWFWRRAVVGFGIAISLLTLLQISRADNAHNREQQDLREKLDQSLLNQQYTKGQLDSLSVMVGHLGQPSAVGTELAAAIKQMARTNAESASDLKASNAELCKRGHAKAEEIRVFQEKYDAAESAGEEQDWQLERLAKTDQERRDLWTKATNRLASSRQAHADEFRNKFMADSKYIRDLLMGRLPPATADKLRGNNGQAEGDLTYSVLAGSFNEYVIADYLDQLATALCPQTNKEKQAKQALYHNMTVHLVELRTIGNKFHDRCASGSGNPPSATEVDAWINGANTYVRNSSLEEHLKTVFQIEGLGWKGTYINVAPGCANFLGKIIGKNSEIYSLEQYLASR